MTQNLFRIVVVCWLVEIAVPAGALNYSLLVRAEQINSTTGEQSINFNLQLRVAALPDAIDSTQLELILPSGQRIGEVLPLDDAIAINAQDVLPTDVGKWEGLWTIEETIGSDVTKHYTFQLPQFATSFLAAPVIYDPPSGASVGRVFDVRWTNPAAFTTLFYNDIAVLPETENLGPGHVRLSTLNDHDFRPLTIDEFSLIVTRSLPINVMRAEAGTAVFLPPMLRFLTHSAPITISIVPEPTALILVGLAGMCATGGRGFVRGDG